MEEADGCVALPLLSQTAGEKSGLEVATARTTATGPQLHSGDCHAHIEDQNMQFRVPKGISNSSTSLDSKQWDSNIAESKCGRSNEQPEVIIHSDTTSVISSLPGEMCRICHCYSEDSDAMISPCGCDGSMKYVHQVCLQKWVKARDTKKCELCGIAYNMTSSVKPFRQWKKLDMSSVERRKVLCSVTFHVVAITCVIWSLYVLIDKTAEEINDGRLNWPFWTKLVVVAIGFTGGLVFMYVQCKMYVQLFKKWKQFNRVIYINDIQVGDIDASRTAQSDAHGSGDGFDDIVIIHMNSNTSADTPDNATTIATTNISNSNHDTGTSS